MRRYEVTDEQWQLIEPLMPGAATTGRKRIPPRAVLNVVCGRIDGASITSGRRGRKGYCNPRIRSWHHPESYALLRDRRAALAWTEWRDLPRLTEVTTDFLYLRWLGERRAIEHYDRVQIDRSVSFDAWERDLRAALPRVREVYGYFNNHWAGHSPASANEMKRRLGLVAVDWRERWTQRELF